MSLFQWDTSLETGLALVDEQHQRLVDMLNQLGDRIGQASRDETLALFKGLADYTVYHFSTEERLMAEGNCSPVHFRLHQVEHENFIHTVSQLSEAYAQGEQGILAAMGDYLVHWLANHILGSDREMARLLGATPPSDLHGHAEHHQHGQRMLDGVLAEQRLSLALRESQERFRVMADSVPALVWMTGAGAERQFFNRTWLVFVGMTLEQARGGGWADCLHPDDRARALAAFQQAFAAQRAYSQEFRLRRADGKYRWILENGEPLRDAEGHFGGMIGSAVDISERKRAEAMMENARIELERQVAMRTAELSVANRQLQAEVEERRQAQEAQQKLIRQLSETHAHLLQAEKMASIGQLAAGIAHEINNPMGFVNANLGSLRRYLDDLFALLDAYEAALAAPDGAVRALREKLDVAYLREDSAALLRESLDGVERVRRIVQALREFAQEGGDDWQWADLNTCLENTLAVAANELRSKGEVRKELGAVPKLYCLPAHLGQVFLNVLLNAAQAIEGQGVITVRSGSADGYAWVEIADDGKGIPPEHLARVFEPFFTTRAVGQGVGLGLSVAYSVVQKHGGRIDINSEPGHGTKVRVQLPLGTGG